MKLKFVPALTLCLLTLTGPARAVAPNDPGCGDAQAAQTLRDQAVRIAPVRASLAQAGLIPEGPFSRRKYDVDVEIPGFGPGIRFLKPVLGGVLYRGGGPGTHTPLSTEALKKLCESGFSNAIYVYGSGTLADVPCTTRDGKTNTLHYQGITWQGAGQSRIMKMIHDTALDPNQGPIFLHCWNGWHASGSVAANSLQQFCGKSSSQALEYWRRNEPSSSGSFPNVTDTQSGSIATFRKDPGLELSRNIGDAICPN